MCCSFLFVLKFPLALAGRSSDQLMSPAHCMYVHLLAIFMWKSAPGHSYTPHGLACLFGADYLFLPRCALLRYISTFAWPLHSKLALETGQRAVLLAMAYLALVKVRCLCSYEVAPSHHALVFCWGYFKDLRLNRDGHFLGFKIRLNSPCISIVSSDNAVHFCVNQAVRFEILK